VSLVSVVKGRRFRPSGRALWGAALGLVLLLAGVGLAEAQRGGCQDRYRIDPNTPFDGRFIFARIRYTYVDNGWWFDYPCTEQNFAAILTELTVMKPYRHGGNVFTFDDPELMRFPIAYVSEPGNWFPDASEAKGLRDYLQKGGFVIFDDFHYDRDWVVFEAGLRKALPDVKIFPMTTEHAIFDSFYKIESLEMYDPNIRDMRAEFYGVYEGNDPTKRLMSIINYNNDIGDYIEWSGTGRIPINLTNDAYKLAVNYIVYGLTR
jgi:hypothetical protein